MNYIDELTSLIDVFNYELCDDCGKDIDKHVIGPDALGHPHAWCLEPQNI